MVESQPLRSGAQEERTISGAMEGRVGIRGGAKVGGGSTGTP